MEMERHELEVIAKKRRTILDIATFMEKGIKIPNLDRVHVDIDKTKL
jgi:hypothetical protein